MQTPNNIAGRVTENIMIHVAKILGGIETTKYNRLYEAIYGELWKVYDDLEKDLTAALAPHEQIPSILRGGS